MPNPLTLDLRRLPAERWFRPFRRDRWWLVGGVTVALAIAVVLVLREVPGSAATLSHGTLYAAIAVGVVAVILLLPLLGIALLSLWRTFTLSKANEEARALLGSGRSDEAGRIFESLCRRARFAPLLHAVFVHNCSVCALRGGDVGRSISLLVSALHSGWLRSRLLPGAYAAAVTSLASAIALEGDVDAAERLQAHAREHVLAAQAGVLAMADAIIALRRGRPADAARGITESWAAAEGVYGAQELRLLRFLLSWALSQLGRKQESADVLAGAREAQPDEIGRFERSWPELFAFLRAAGVTVAPA